jgi:hypothetical protein
MQLLYAKQSRPVAMLVFANQHLVWCLQILSEVCNWIAQAAEEFGLAAFNVKVKPCEVALWLPPMPPRPEVSLSCTLACRH